MAGLIKNIRRVYPKNNLRLQAEVKFRTHLKKVDQGSCQGAGRRKSGAYTLVCEHFEPIRNTAMSTQTLF
jgi:hypothetical protein